MDDLKILLKMFYAPVAAMRQARERVSLLGAALVAFVAHAGYVFYAESPYLGGAAALASPRGLVPFFSVALGATHTLLFITLVFVPVVIFVANLFERRGGLRARVGQEFAGAAGAILFAWAAASLAALPLLIILRVSGFESLVIAENLTQFAELREQYPDIASMVTPRYLAQVFASMALLFFFLFWGSLAVREVFRLSVGRTLAVVVASGVLMYPVFAILYPLFRVIIGSPLLLVVLFIFGRGYLSELTRGRQARDSFRQNLEAATANPADASAHYNLGLIHLERDELAEARERFARAVSIDVEELDAHYQLGRISRREGKYAEAIEHFGRVVERDPSHAQHEVWREIGATYLVADQPQDARDALERFLEHRTVDPEGLYLMGHALAATGRPREAKELMRQCIDAVRAAPAYKYRMERRWLSEAENFLRSQA